MYLRPSFFAPLLISPACFCLCKARLASSPASLSNRLTSSLASLTLARASVSALSAARSDSSAAATRFFAARMLGSSSLLKGLRECVGEVGTGSLFFLNGLEECEVVVVVAVFLGLLERRRKSEVLVRLLVSTGGGGDSFLPNSGMLSDSAEHEVEWILVDELGDVLDQFLDCL